MTTAFAALVLALPIAGCGGGSGTSSTTTVSTADVSAALDKAQGKLFGACTFVGTVAGAKAISGSSLAQKQIVEANQAIQEAIALAKQTEFGGDLHLPSGKTVSQVLTNLAATAQTNHCDPIGAREITAALTDLSTSSDTTTSSTTTTTPPSSTTTTAAAGILNVRLRNPKPGSDYSIGDQITASGTINEAAYGRVLTADDPTCQAGTKGTHFNQGSFKFSGVTVTKPDQPVNGTDALILVCFSTPDDFDTDGALIDLINLRH